jgi:uncharacterized OB-fold protein
MKSQSTTPKPAPTPTVVSAPFWDAAKQHRLLIQQCGKCAQTIFYPRLRCPHCWSNDLSWIEASGKGEVASYTIIHKPGHPAFAAGAPYIVALIDLEERVRLLSNVVDCPIDQVHVGMPVTVQWVEQGDFTLPKFQPSISKV